MITTAYDALYLSPHLDDVALSCGGQIWQRTQAGERILIVTITAADAPADLSPFAEDQHQSMQLGANPVAQRRTEDVAACAVLGADYLHLDVLDCIYRRHPVTGDALYQTDDAIFGAVHSAETTLLAPSLATLPAHQQLIVPLGIGNHVDHQLVVAATKHLPVQHYPDYPYTQRTHYQPPSSSAWHVDLITLSEAALVARIAAIAAYRSQVPHLFGSAEAMKTAVRAEHATVGGELLLTKISPR